MTITKEGALASFYTVNKAPIKHLRVYFSPKQAGSGNPAPDNVREISGWEKIIVNSVPEEYQEVEYIESPGTASSTSSGAYINTSIIPYFDLCSEIIYKAKANGYAYGSIYGNNTDYYGWNTSPDTSGRIKPYFGTGNYPSIYGYPMNNFHKLTISNKKCYVDDILIYDYNKSSNTFNFTNATTIYIGALHQSPTVMTSGKFKTAYFWDYSTKNYLGIFIPCYRKSDNAVGMYDVITKQFFQSETNQSFIAGPNVSTVIQADWSNDIGTVYGGYVDLVTGEIAVEQIKNDFETLSWSTRYTGDTNIALSANLTDMYDAFTDVSPCICEKYKVIDFVNSAGALKTPDNCDIGVYWYRNSGYTVVKTIYTVIDKNSSPSGNIVYKLKTPITHQLTPTQLSTLLGHNNIWSNADRVEVEYDLAESNDELYRRRNIILQSAPHIETASGAIANFNTDLAAPLRECRVSFLPTQEGSGDPSPENVREIGGWTGLDLYQTGKNLIDTSTLTGTTSVWWKGSVIGGYPDHCVTPKIPVCPGQTYTINRNSNAQSYVSLFDKDGNYIDQIIQDTYRPDRLYGDDVYYVGITIGTEYLTNPYPQLELGSQQTDYEPYCGQIISLDWSSTAGTIYGGYVDLGKGKLVQEYINFPLVSTLWWQSSGRRPTVGGIYFYADYVTAPLYTPGQWSSIITKEQYTHGKVNNPYEYIGNYAWGQYGANRGTIRLGFSDEMNITSVDALKNWLDTQGNVSICYPLLTPIEYSLTPQTLKTLKGTNNIWSNTNGTIEVKYWRH